MPEVFNVHRYVSISYKYRGLNAFHVFITHYFRNRYSIVKMPREPNVLYQRQKESDRLAMHIHMEKWRNCSENWTWRDQAFSWGKYICVDMYHIYISNEFPWKSLTRLVLDHSWPFLPFPTYLWDMELSKGSNLEYRPSFFFLNCKVHTIGTAVQIFWGHTSMIKQLQGRATLN